MIEYPTLGEGGGDSFVLPLLTALPTRLIFSVKKLYRIFWGRIETAQRVVHDVIARSNCANPVVGYPSSECSFILELSQRVKIQVPHIFCLSSLCLSLMASQSTGILFAWFLTKAGL